MERGHPISSRRDEAASKSEIGSGRGAAKHTLAIIWALACLALYAVQALAGTPSAILRFLAAGYQQ